MNETDHQKSGTPISSSPSWLADQKEIPDPTARAGKESVPESHERPGTGSRDDVSGPVSNENVLRIEDGVT